ncbi:MAG: bifunctional metallophosphatase/5'-nucleotidase [Prolixibacteraceae bacterium]|nr:bifunctional metallophosphatase/5'-nucleotidase [Prolixibacteraceae bacterium]MBT6005642.1 bifunctional metallophosphatase/5'-nucleotidase [Prolixibacteraceae bacterium]MBT6763587.1 bifunctional metallophosphatase/5'-nucleotidase [Prolixibacteraceae bacterium]MBT6999309.1 bifunctional metallophosphatase/5'-nucleotidase [Prolixibacteraceae bacterium]MBT7393205.1 bifunctional metallophosphatase/5'-nucleotidase [Prolixibacteraceae bacterium]
MNRRNFIRNIATGSVGISLGALPFELLANDDFVTISFLHTNDMHCHIEPFTGTNERYNGKGGIARISELAKNSRLENPNTLLFDAGDMFQGTPYFNYFKGDLMLDVMSAAGYDAGTIGNHEFDNGLSGILEPLPNAEFPLINSNYDFSDTILAGKFPRWKIFKRSGIKIGVYGLGIELKGLVSDNNIGNTIYTDPLKVAAEMETFLKKDQKCDLVVCLSHLGLRYRENIVSDLVLAGETSMTDLIIGGHTHSYLEEPIIQKNKIGKQVIVNQAWWGGLVIGKIDFVFERSRKRKKAIFANKINTLNET